MSLALENAEARIAERLEASDLHGAITIALQAYGPEIIGFLLARERDETAASEVYSAFCEDLWRGIGGFRRESSFRSWAYALARNAAHRRRSDPFAKRGVPLSQVPAIYELAEKIRTTTLLHLRTEVRDAVTRLRERLDVEDQELLVLRVNREMSWKEIAVVFQGVDAPPAAITRKAASLRKRFERVKGRLRDLAREEGLLGSNDG